MVKNLPAVRETQIPSLDQEDPLATHSSILASEIPGTEEPGGLQSIAVSESDKTERLTHTHTHVSVYICVHTLFMRST